MEPVESNHCDRTDWPHGPWDDEPDRVEWRIGPFAALIVRNHSGALCGYVGVPAGHPAHGKHYSDDLLRELNCHGGLTFADKCQAGGKICHVPQLGESDAVWWLGFDCNHCGDMAPGMSRFYRDDSGYYWRINNVKTEVEFLAKQLAVLVAP